MKRSQKPLMCLASSMRQMGARGVAFGKPNLVDLELGALIWRTKPTEITIMNTIDLMKDPFFVSLLFQIEAKILAADKKGSSQGITLTDSQVRSVAYRASKAAQGSAPSISADSPRDKLLAELYNDILGVRSEIVVSNSEGLFEPLSTKDWTLALRAVEDSIRRRSTGSGSRSYLEFLAGFLSGVK